ncbi:MITOCHONDRIAL IMPORT INNER MEMBRANE TRANSLOCASE SUBUNIT TIM23-3 [Salix viminalis]|uniref:MITOCHONDRIAL IMPORT INNER MEMBRANE TRANSLOCASE SUBUNIT TIM23-3 n=1 Tax=Salix viminalis TaxID=40686 RepID=A0A9Q0ZK77_SALVM|nr:MITOCHONDRIAL IMPORT INNER MEMBRANE TRANSLOCASE SUBUNIT TIM23-3 [Salix viminalis]
MNDPNDHKYRKYHPYQGLYDVPAQNLYNLPTSPEFLFDEEALHQRRSWSESLQYYTGTGYLAGAVLGGAKGIESGLIHWRDTDDLVNTVLAGLGTGAIYRAAKGPRSAAIAGAIGGIAAAAVVAGKQAVKEIRAYLKILKFMVYSGVLLILVGISWYFQWRLNDNLGITGGINLGVGGAGQCFFLVLRNTDQGSRSKNMDVASSVADQSAVSS